ncbi:MAG: hypothetical protein EKK41_05055 [Hyphomicrobiales bacterium]|nr:MAG: hypothetical protein EKK41_05055 [Hyphomicrobiales bacterium]
MGENSRFWVAFSILLLAFALFTIMSVWMTIQAHAEPLPSPPIVHITDDPGGNVGVYYQKYAALDAAGAEVHFHGMCASACGIVLFQRFTHIRACADDGAIFGFHKPFQERDGKVVRTKSAVRDTRKLWAMWLRALPDPLRKYLQRVRVPSAAEGDEQNVMLILPGSLLLPKCPMTIAAQ